MIDGGSKSSPTGSLLFSPLLIARPCRILGLFHNDSPLEGNDRVIFCANCTVWVLQSKFLIKMVSPAENTKWNNLYDDPKIKVNISTTTKIRFHTSWLSFASFVTDSPRTSQQPILRIRKKIIRTYKFIIHNITNQKENDGMNERGVKSKLACINPQIFKRKTRGGKNRPRSLHRLEGEPATNFFGSSRYRCFIFVWCFFIRSLHFSQNNPGEEVGRDRWQCFEVQIWIVKTKI